MNRSVPLSVIAEISSRARSLLNEAIQELPIGFTYEGTAVASRDNFAAPENVDIRFAILVDGLYKISKTVPVKVFRYTVQRELDGMIFKGLEELVVETKELLTDLVSKRIDEAI